MTGTDLTCCVMIENRAIDIIVIRPSFEGTALGDFLSRSFLI